jgi:hypothetical protein
MVSGMSREMAGTLRKQGPGEREGMRGSSSGKDTAVTSPQPEFDPQTPLHLQLSGSVTAQTAADPDHNPGGKPSVMTAKCNIADSPRYFQRLGPALPQRDGVSRHERFGQS